MNVSLLHNELISIGLNISGCSSDGTIHLNEPDTANLAPLVLAAHEQTLTSDECLALQVVITEAQWLAYQECRKAPVKQARAVLYKETTDPLLLSAIETALKAATASNGEVTIVLSESSVSEWLTAKDEVRTNNSYPE